MAIIKTKISTFYGEDGAEFDHYDYRGLHDDTKPTEDVAENDLFLELDTGDVYYFTGETWAKVGA